MLQGSNKVGPTLMNVALEYETARITDKNVRKIMVAACSFGGGMCGILGMSRGRVDVGSSCD